MGRRGSQGSHSLLAPVPCHSGTPPFPKRERDAASAFVAVAAAAGRASLPFLVFSIMHPAAAGMFATRGAWDGSDVDEEHIEFLRHRRKLSSAEFVAARVSGAENSRAPQAGEVVVFAEHFARVWVAGEQLLFPLPDTSACSRTTLPPTTCCSWPPMSPSARASWGSSRVWISGVDSFTSSSRRRSTGPLATSG